MPLSRAEQMSRIRGSNTSPELVLRRKLWARSLRYRVQYPTPKGRADLAFVRSRLAVFVDGCQWHGCPEHYVRPRTNTSFWAEKLAKNVARDQEQTISLRAVGWRVLRYWEHEIFVDAEAVASEIEKALIDQAEATRDSWRVWKVEPVDGSNAEISYMQLLGNPEICSIIEKIRSTRKWKRGK
jgi:DNA mismatch endonuclease, patch repair protein